MLEVKNLTVVAEGKTILHEISFQISEGETHILMGPNGSGKTTVLHAIMGTGNVAIQSGQIIFEGEDVTALPAYERARRGIGVASQRPPSIPELTLRSLVELVQQSNNGVQRIDELVEIMNCGYLMDRNFNVNFSGGESKRAEFLQLLIQNPKLALIDEPESGVDLDNIGVIGRALHQLLKEEKVLDRHKSGLIITHTGHILDYLNADRGYVLISGQLVCSGNPRDLFEEVEKHGYEGCVQCLKCQ